MKSFWSFARRMLRYRSTLVAALALAILSAGGLGVGLLGVAPVLQNILPTGAEGGQDLPELAAQIDARLGGALPDEWIAALPPGEWTAVVVIIGVLGFLTVFGGVANFGHAYLSLTVVQRTVTAIRREAFHRVVRLPLKDIVAHGPSDTISRIVNDTGALGTGFNALLSKAVSQISKGVAALFAAFWADWRLTLVAVLVAPLMAVIIRKLGKRIRRASRAALESQSDLYRAAAESLQGLRVVKVHTTERYEAGRFHKYNKAVMREMMRVRTARALASPVVEVLAILALGALSLIFAKAIIDGNLDPHRFILAIASLGIAGASLKPLTGIVNDIQSSAGAADRLADLLRAAPEPGHDARLPKLPRLRESIEFRSVTFTYPRALQPSLSAVDLTIRHGKTVAFVGPNGSGKTTLLSLVPRLFDPDAPAGRPAGAVLFDGRDIREVSVRSLRRQIGVVTQETILFRGTIRSNIAYGAESATEEQILDAARRARADEFISALPQGYDTPVGEQGLTLSGGQRQRIAIARAILRDPAILILDEATSMIDADSESRIADALTDFSEGRTCLIVAHRLSTVVNADRIVVMDAGAVVDVGTHAELLDRCDLYQTLASKQLLGGSDGAAERRSDEGDRRPQPASA